jgi:putative phage-type endonuclease
MLIHNLEQGTQEWHELRAGIPTASEFSKIITSTGKSSTQAKDYLNLKVAEKIAGGKVETWQGNQWTERGNELEQEAVDYYSFKYDRECDKVGFVTDDLKRYGASPDRLISDDWLLEIKCPAPHTQIKYLRDGKLPTDYFVQVQGQLWVTERKFCDFFAYHPDLPCLKVIVERDDDFIKNMEAQVLAFCDEVEKVYMGLVNV